MKQTTKFLHILMCMVLGLSVSMTSCKDYDDDIDGLNQRVDALESSLSQLTTQFGELAYVQSVTYNEETRLLTVVDSEGQTHTYTTPDEKGEDTNTTYTIATALSADGKKVEITLTPSNGAPQTVSFDLPTSFDSNALSIDAEGWICYNGIRTSAQIPANETESFDAGKLTIGEDNFIYYGDEKTTVQLDKFNPNALTVKDGVLCYNGEETTVTIPETPGLEIVEIKNANGVVTGYAITYGENPTVNLMIEAGILKGMVFEPQAYLNGVEAMKARYIKTADWDQIVSDATPTTTGEVWSKATADDKDELFALEIPAKIVARYHINPSNIDVNCIKEVRFVTDNKEYVMTKAANELGAKLEKKEIVKEGDEQMLQLTFTIDADKLAAAGDISVVAVQAVVVDPNATSEEAVEQLVTSDYAAILNTTITDFRLASADIEKYVGDDEGEGHLWGTDNGKAESAIKGANVDDIAPKVITVLYDNSVKVKLEDYVVAHYTEVDYEGDPLISCSKDKVLNREELNALGLDIRFVASNYITGDNQTPQNEFFTVDEKTGEITTKVYQESGAAAIGRMPLVRVELYNIANPEEVANVGWIKLLIVRGTSEGTQATLDFGEIAWGCNAVEKTVSVEFMNTQIYNKLGLSKDDFHAIYTFDGTNEDGDGTVEEVEDEIADETTIVKWTISDAELKAAEDGDVFEAKAVYTAKGREDVVITLKATVKHPEAAEVGDKIDEYWGNDGMDYVRLNVEVVDTDNQCDFVTDLFNTFRGNTITIDVDEDFADFAKLNYEFIFSDKNIDRKVKGLSGTEYTLLVSGTGKTLYANVADEDHVVARLSGDANATVTYSENEYAKDLLNRAAHDELGEASFYALMNIKATNGCELEYPLVNNGEFKAYFLRPVDIVGADIPAVLEDAKTNGSTINIMDLISLIDWRNEDFAFKPVNFYKYYEVEQIVALAGNYADEKYPIYTSLDGGDINKTKLEEVTKKLVLTATEGKPSSYPTGEEGSGLDKYGQLTLKNNGAAVGKPFQLNVPVKVVYKWGEVIEYVLVDVTQTQGN